ncbi:phosphatidylinositol 4,5-bisphosphate 3-kinase catalytic subunit delta isoform isoform X2 [Coccinella septempunctata]|uniref:phosphatidylinositol 4,5-bisphosphate 3-kinase catalytic subunit delta isoform isoform X2 n=1 Tax=Coccinella septempunctata TaxID=41139 RepID=UPI001D07FD04|nr:phosphatidylinositol 4,5-bisphosphate 3-kinase catalytic subunit delta isoform isoform X2 [Coccinella septempunctata]
MAPIPAEYLYDFWDTYESNENDHIELTCLMPNGIVILLKVQSNATLGEIKEDLWDEAANYPLYGKLYDISGYVFMYVNNMAEQVKVIDECRRLCDTRPVGGIFKIVEAKTDKLDETTSGQVGHLIGKRLQEFDSMNSPEINNFRFKMRKLGEDIAKSREKLTWQQKVFYQFPPRISVPNILLLNQIGHDKNIKIATKFGNSDNSYNFTFDVSMSIGPTKFLEIVLTKKATIFNTKNERPNDYVLKVCGRDDFIMGEEPLINFQYIQESLSYGITPVLVTVNVCDVPITTEGDYECIGNFDKKPRPSYSTLTLRKKGKCKSAWDLISNFRLTLSKLRKLNLDPKRASELYIGLQVGLFHGGKSLCEAKRTEDLKVTVVGDQCECDINVSFEFDMLMCNIPKNVKLCFVVYEVNKSYKGGKFKKSKEANKDPSYNPIAWANTTLYDFKDQLRTGPQTLYMWTYAEENFGDDLLHPLGTVVNNPDIRNVTALTIIFESHENQIIVYPCPEAMLEYAQALGQSGSNNITTEIGLENIKNYEKNFDYDNFYEMHDQDRKNIWNLKHYWKEHNPVILPKILYCIDWDRKETFAEVVALLKEWPLLPAEKALELLDYAYADQEVRSYAVQCFQEMSDDDLLLYLLQLVQALKHELFLECDLIDFLLKRALANQKIGHYLFWHLRSEMQVPSVSVRFGLILEAYCRGAQEHIGILQQQLTCLEKLKKCQEVIRTRKDKDKAKSLLHNYMQGQSSEFLRGLRNPLDPSYRCDDIKIEKCRVMDSKMRPLWIVFGNADSYGDDIYLIFKNGDDLRQDMLTLQLLRIMDKLWKQEGLDLRMNVYNCVSTDNRVGLIEVVLQAETIANIQKGKGMFSVSSAFRKGSIFDWLKDYNTTEAALNQAVNEFTLSCAGYCVATYVLGIGDRHSDNIMIKRTGQLFHIDFGHILGHFKEKFGIKRERVPFVLTHDFVHVINKGAKYSIEFKIFQEYCEKAFLILRKHGNLILSLCAMMISTGLPELSSEKDLNYLRETLVLLKSEKDALEHFKSKFNEALSNSWKTSLNWASHNLAKNNT